MALPKTPSQEAQQLRKDVDDLKGWMRESKMLLRVCTGCGVLISGILVSAVPSWIGDHKDVAYMRPKVETLWWHVFPVAAKIENNKEQQEETN